jgi:hypothetical protein
MDYATGGTIWNWGSSDRSADEWFSMIFQVFAGIYAIQKYFNMSHHDLHPDNILCYEVQEGGYWKYIIDSKIYYVPNKGHLFILWDFSFGLIPKYPEWVNADNIKTLSDNDLDIAVQNALLKNKENRVRKGDVLVYGKRDRPFYMYDYGGITYMIKWFQEERVRRERGVRTRVPDSVKNLERELSEYLGKKEHISKIIPELFAEKYRQSSENIIQTYDMNTKIRYQGNDEWLNNYVNKNMLI